MLQQLLINIDWQEILSAGLATLFMISIATIISAFIGIPIGIILYISGNSNLLNNFWSKLIYKILSFTVNVLRSIPFIILLIIMMPLTNYLVGTSLGTKGVIPPLIIGAFPFFARLIQNALQELDDGIINMAKAYGASIWQIIWYILLPEILPRIISTITLSAITLVSYTAMAGAVGGGGLGDLAIRYGYQRFQSHIMIITVILLVILVQLIQYIGDYLVKSIRK